MTGCDPFGVLYTICVGSKRSVYWPGLIVGASRPVTPPTTPPTTSSSPPRSPAVAGATGVRINSNAIVTMARARVMVPPSACSGSGDLAGQRLQYRVDHAVELIHRDRLRQHRPPGFLQEAVRSRAERVTRHEDNASGKLGPVPRDPLPDRLAVDVGQAQVED